MFVFLPNQRLSFPYNNYRGETSQRIVEFRGLDFGSNEWYPEEQWFMRCFDEEKNAFRSFALHRIDPRKIIILSAKV